MARELVHLATPALSAGARVIASPFQFTVTGEDHLRLRVANAVEGVEVNLHGRFLNQDGTITPFAHQVRPEATRGVETTDFQLAEGALINVVLFASGSEPGHGQTWAQVQVIRGFGGATIQLGVLCQGYISDFVQIAFPGSPNEPPQQGPGSFQVVSGTDPAAGVEVSEAVPTNTRWRLLWFLARLTTDATAATRKPRFRLNTGVINITLPQPFTVGSSTNIVPTWVAGMAFENTLDTSRTHSFLPTDLVVPNDTLLQTKTDNLQAGDQWDLVRLGVEEWIVPRP